MNNLHLTWRTAILIASLATGLSVSAVAQTDALRSFTEPAESVRVAFSQPGKLQKLNVREGEWVRAGVVLATLDEGALGVMHEIARVRAADRSPIAAEQAEVDSLTQRVSDLRELVTSGGSSPSEVRRVATDLEIATAKLESAKRNHAINALEVKRLAAERRKYELPAPIDGYVVEVLKRPGEFIGTNEPEVLELVQLDPLKIRFHVPIETVARLTAGQSVRVDLPQSGEQASASIARISPVIDPESATVMVEVSLQNPDLKYRSGAQCLWKRVPGEALSPSTQGNSR